MLRRYPLVGFLIVACGYLVVLYADAFFGGRVLSQADLLFDYAPWSAHRPAGFTAPGNTLLGDIPQVFYPFLMETAAALRRGSLPVWSAALFAGHPFLASFQTATFSPFTAPALVLPAADALLAGGILKLLVGGVGMWVFLRRLGLALPAVWFGATAYLLNAFSVLWIEHPVSAVSAWLPLLFWSVDRLLASRSARDVALLGAFVGIVILAGHPETSYKVLLFGAAYGLAGLWARGGQGLSLLATRFVPAAIIGFGLAAIQLVPFAEYLQRSFVWEYRNVAAANAYPAPLETVVTAVVPNFLGNPSKGLYLPMENAYGVISNFCEQNIYPGVVTWILASIGLWTTWRSWRGRFLAAAAVAGAAVMYGLPGFIHLMMLIPGASVIVLSRFGLVTLTAAIVLAAFGVEALTRPVASGAKPRLLPAVVTALVMTAGVLAFLFWAHGFLAANGLLAATLWWCGFAAALAVVSLAAIALRLRARLTATSFATVVVALVVVDLMALGWRFHPMIPREQVFATTPELDLVRRDPGLFRVAGIGTALLPNTAMAYGLQDLRGYDGMQPSAHGDVVGISHKGGAYRVVKDSETFHVLDLMNVKYIFADAAASLPAPHFTRLSLAPGAIVFRNERAFARAFLVDRATVLTPAESLRRIREDRVDLRREAVLDEPLAADERPEPGVWTESGMLAGETARVTRYENTFVEVQTSTAGRRLLILGDIDYPGWQATIDGRPARILRANRGVRAVPVPAGSHTVAFRLVPRSLHVGAAISLLALLALVALAWRRRSG